MGRKKKPFIDKKNATRYKLVHRSQHDPLIADEDASQMVFKELTPADSNEEESARLAEQRQCGIFYEDDYDYMQHVRDRTEEGAVVREAANPTKPGKIELPVCVLPSATEEPVGMLNLAAPQGLDLSLDPDIMAALDDDFDFDDPDLELEDDFIGLAEGAVLAEYGDRNDGSSTEEEDGETSTDEVDSMFSEQSGRRSDDEFGATCRFTEYSVSSSVLPRNEGLTLLDDRFEEMYKEYDHLGAGDEELAPIDELDTQEPNLVLEQLCDEFERNNLSDEETVEITKARTLELASRQVDLPEKQKVVLLDTDQAAGIPWDCETILSTYSNIYNHPKLIDIPKKIKLNKKGVVVEEKGDDEGVIREEEGEDDESSEEENATVISNYRTKSETAEEKRQRKKAVKESQRLRRQVKKATKEVFKEENTKQKLEKSSQRGRVVKL